MGGFMNHDGGKYFTILNGKFCQRVPDNTEGAVKRTNKLGKIVYEKFYDSFVGKLVGVKTTDESMEKVGCLISKTGKTYITCSCHIVIVMQKLF